MGEEPNICKTPIAQLRAQETNQSGTRSGSPCSQRLEDVKQTHTPFPIAPRDILGAQLCILLPDGHHDPQGLILHV